MQKKERKLFQTAGKERVFYSKKGMFFPVMVLTALLCFAEERADGFSVVPLLNYEFVSLENQQYHAPGGGLTLLRGDQQPPLPEQYNTLMIGLFYKSFIMKEIRPDFSELYHDIVFIVEKRTGPHLIQGIFRSNSDKPVYGGMQTTYSSLGYGHELIRRENLHLTLGLALGVSDFGIYLPNGIMLPLFPQPIIRFGLHTSIINLSLDWPELKISLAPESRIRMTGAVRLDAYGFKDVNDFTFNGILWYRFFSKDFKMGDFAGIGLGVKNEGMDFTPGEKGRKYDMNHYSVFGILDASFIKISGGYVFYSRELFDAGYRGRGGDGFFVKAEVLYKF